MRAKQFLYSLTDRQRVGKAVVCIGCNAQTTTPIWLAGYSVLAWPICSDCDCVRKCESSTT